tara:strand:+ start:125 stop:1981 length:1857 start_codon:yes stop_codon:yes gene_type:complete
VANYILGISCFYHDSAAALIADGKILSAVQEERISRQKHDSRFPKNAILYCLEANELTLDDIFSIIYYEKPFLTFERLLETYIATAPRGSRSFISAMQVWLKEKLFLKSLLKKEFKSIQGQLFPSKKIKLPNILYAEHHQSHAAAAFYPSHFNEAVILCMDGVGEWSTTSAWIGKGNKIQPIWDINFPHSLGLLYSAFTYYCGFKVNSGEYKLMGLAPYGNPIYVEKIKKNLIDIKEDGTFRLNISFFKYHRGFRMTSNKFNRLFGKPPRKKETDITQFHMDLAASIQKVTEEVVLKLAKSLRMETGIKNLCLAGGVALNCVANGKLVKEQIFDDIWIQPASGDAGSALGAALLAYYQYFKKNRIINPDDSMKGTYLGCEFSNSQITNYLKRVKAPYEKFKDEILFEMIAEYLDKEKVIGWFNGPMEFGPRALGARSIIGDPRSQNMQNIMNLKIKFRESFRPFAPSILEEDFSDVFELDIKSPYMLLVAPIKKDLRKTMSKEQLNLFGIEKLNVPRSNLPAITHIDYSSRIQTVSLKTNPRFHELISTFKKRTGCSCVVNTSFNVRGEPIVCTPQDAYRCFMRTEMDILVMQNVVLFKADQPSFEKDEKWKQEFDLD